MSYNDDNFVDEQDPDNDDPPLEPDDFDVRHGDKWALEFIWVVAGIVILAVTWLWYVVNDEWYWVLIPLLLVIGTCYVLYRLEPTLSHQAFLTTICLVHTWLVFLVEPNGIAFFVGLIVTFLGLRVILLFMRGTEREATLESFRKLEEPIKINDRLALQLHGDERYVFVSHLHIIDAIWWFIGAAVWFAGFFAAYLFTNLSFLALLILWAIGGMALALKLLVWQHELVCRTTNRRFFMLEGILKKSASETSLDKITDQTLTIPRTSTILSWLRLIKEPYGYFKGETAGQNEDKKKIENKIGPIPHAEAFKRAATEMMTPPAQHQS